VVLLSGVYQSACLKNAGLNPVINLDFKKNV